MKTQKYGHSGIEVSPEIEVPDHQTKKTFIQTFARPLIFPELVILILRYLIVRLLWPGRF